MNKIEVFIDGFNLYHGIRDCNKTSTYRKVLWLDLASFLKSVLIHSNEDILNGIYYFTALPKDAKDREERHKKYCEVLTDSGVHIIYGTYKTKKIKCRLCHKTFATYEEKETDVNIALYMLKRGIEDGYDKAVLFSGDSDLAPAVEKASELFPQKKFQVLFPINRNRSKRLKKMNVLEPIYPYLLYYKKNQFPENVYLKNGSIITRPSEWA